MTHTSHISDKRIIDLATTVDDRRLAPPATKQETEHFIECDQCHHKFSNLVEVKFLDSEFSENHLN